MADFDFSTLITDRGQSDLATLRSVLSTPMEEWTAEQLAAFNQAASRGAYNYTDLNRVTEAMTYLDGVLRGYGYETGFVPIKVHGEPEPDKPLLPDGYTQLSYIESTGTQYIDTGFKPNQDTRIIVDFEKISVIGQWADPIYGVRTSASSNAYYFWCPGNSSSTKDKFQFGYNNQTIYLGENIIGRHHVDQNKNIITVDGESSQANYSKFATSWNLLLFQSYDNGRLRENGSNVRLFYCKIYDNGNLIRDYLPCINPSSEIGLYDLVEKKFYGNAGSGVFSYAYIPGKLPEGFAELEYLESTGTQYINTGVNPDQDTRVVADLQPIAVSICGIFGARIAKETACFVLWQVDQTTIEDNYGSDATRVSVPSTTTRVLVDKNKNQLSYGNTIFTAAEETFSCNYPMALFGVNSGGVIDNRRVSMRLYSCKIYDNVALVRDFVPCINPSGAVGLYDLANGAFYANAGTGVFAAGPEIPPEPEPEPEPEPLDPYTWYEEDVPTESTMAGYLANVSALREVLTLPENTAEVPADMAGLTLAEANAIEEILLVIEDYLTALASVFRRCDAAICGGPGFYFKN